ncbi:MAG: DUF542 domain-containing protein [bacterium]|nr:DUF542 domain-containing protein [bacterium]
MSITLETPVGHLVVEKPGRAHIFQRFQIDYCCGGAKPLGQACTAKNLDPQVVLAEIANKTAARMLIPSLTGQRSRCPCWLTIS